MLRAKRITDPIPDERLEAAVVEDEPEMEPTADPIVPRINARAQWIEVFGYRGYMSEEKVIPAGKYRANDPALLGLANYLVATGHAVPLEEEE